MAVRNEKVILSLQDDFSTPMARAAAATALANKELRDLSGTSTDASRDTDGLTRSTDRSSDAFRKGSTDIDRYSGRLRLITEAVTVLGPGLIPLGAAGVPAVTALAAGLGAAGGALGVLLLGFNGLGDALEAIDTARLEPTVENLQAMRDELDKLGPAGADFARYLTSLRPELEKLQMIARQGMFPGFEDGLDDLLTRLPEVQRIVAEIATGLGDLGADAGSSLAGPRFEAFFDYLETDAAPTMEAFARSTGNVVEGLANLLVAFAPLTSDFTGGMERMTRSFANWTAGLSKTDGFRSFVSYIRESGPQAVEFLGAISMAFVGIIRAAAPFGQAVLPALTALANVLAAIANSPVGPPLFTAAAGFLAVSRASTLASAGVAKFNAAAATTGGLGLAGRLAGIAAVFGLLGNELAKLNGSKIDLSKLDADLDAIADGGGSDALNHISESLKTLNDNMPDAYEIATLGGLFGNTPKDNAADYIKAYDEQLAALVESGNAEKAAKIFAQIQEARTGMSAETTQFRPFGESAEEFSSYAAALEDAASGTSDYAAANELVAISARKTRAELRGLVAAMEQQTSAALGAFDAVTQYGQALASARDAADEGRRGINENTKAGRENREALSGLAAAWNNQSDAVRNNVGKYREARKAFIDTATAMGAPIDRARDLANRLMEIPRSVLTRVSADTSKANANLNVLYGRLAELRGTSTTTYIDVVTRSFNAKRDGIPGGPGGSADGGSVPKTGLPYADRHPYMLADGEEVISNRHGQADRHRSLLKAINAGRLADGGTTGGRRSTFDVAGGGDFGPMPRTVGGAVAAILDLRGSLRDLRGDIRDSAKQIKLETKERDRLSSVVDRNQDALDTLNGLFQDLASAVKANLTSDQFANVPGVANDNPWGSSAASTSDRPPTIDEIIATLNQDSANAGAMLTATNTLKGKGLNDAALKSILEQGLETSQMFAALDPAKLLEYSNALGIRTLTTDAASTAAGGAVYGERIAAAEANLAESKGALREQTLAVREVTAEARISNRIQERMETQLGRMTDELGQIKAQIKKARGELDSAERGKR